MSIFPFPFWSVKILHSDVAKKGFKLNFSISSNVTKAGLEYLRSKNEQKIYAHITLRHEHPAIVSSDVFL